MTEVASVTSLQLLYYIILYYYTVLTKSFINCYNAPLFLSCITAYNVGQMAHYKSSL